MNDNTPNAGKLIESLRSTGYSNYSAIADLVDNSLDAHATNVKIKIGTTKNDHLLIISDDGDGMNEAILDQALRLGSDTPKDNASDLGKFGMGLITASISIGRRLVVITRQHGQFLTAVHDIDDIVEKKEFVKELRASTKQEMETFALYTGGAMHGTVVLISKIDHLQSKNLTQFSNKLINDMGEIFREYINAGKHLYVNEKDILARDPLMLNDTETDIMLDEAFELDVDGDGEPDNIRLRIVALPMRSDVENEAMKINQFNQGFYIMRNNRQIARAETLGVFTKHNYSNRFRAELFFSGSLDGALSVNFTKNGIELNDAVTGWLTQMALPQITTIRNQAKKEGARKANEGKTHRGAERIVETKGNVLPDFKPDTVDEAADASWRDNHKNTVEFKTAEKGRLGSLFEHETYGRKITVTYNIEHPFYQVFFGSTENNDLIDAMDCLVYSMAAGLTKMTLGQEEQKLADIFSETMSSTLRTLLN
jgi:hypothetical protein